MIQLNTDYINKIQILNDDLSQYVNLVDYDGDGEEFIFTFDGKAKIKWSIEKFGEDDGSLVEWTSDEIHDLLEETIENKKCTPHDKIFLDHLISYLSDENDSHETIVVTSEMSAQIHKIQGVCREIILQDIGWKEWGSFFERKGYSIEVSMMTKILIKLPNFNFVVDNKENSGVPSEVSFYEGKFAGWIVPL